MTRHRSTLASSDLLPLVTVVVPTIGRPDYVVDTIRSILVQTYSNLQILISDNAPDVATAPLLVAAGISDARIDIVTRSERLSFSAHMNFCIADARGTHLMILSDDDQLSSGYVEEMVRVMQLRPEVAVCLGRQIKITEHDRGVMIDRISPLPQTIIDGVSFLRDSLSGDLQTGVLTYISMFARKADILRAGGFSDYPDGSHADNFIIFNLALCGHVALTRNLMFYRVYLASFGLRTPFSALLEATSAYTRDGARLLRATPAVAEIDKMLILRSLKSNNFRLLLSRLRHVYWRRLSIAAFVGSILQVVKFKLTHKGFL